MNTTSDEVSVSIRKSSKSLSFQQNKRNSSSGSFCSHNIPFILLEPWPNSVFSSRFPIPSTQQLYYQLEHYAKAIRFRNMYIFTHAPACSKLSLHSYSLTLEQIVFSLHSTPSCLSFCAREYSQSQYAPIYTPVSPLHRIIANLLRFLNSVLPMELIAKLTL